MSDKNIPQTVRTTVVVSPAHGMTMADWKRWGVNLLVFGAPTLAVFFSQLALKVDPKIAAGVALLVFWQALADFWKKYTGQSITLAEGAELPKSP